MELLQISTQVTLIQLVGVSVTILTIVGAAWINMKVNVAKIETKLLEVESQVKADRLENKSMFEKIDTKLDKILQKQVEQTIAINNKKDKE